MKPALSRLPLSVVIGTVLALWLLNLTLPYILCKQPSELGTFGDMFGAVNALFSGMALIGVIWTISQQREEMRSNLKSQQQIMAAQERQLKLAAYTALLNSINQQIVIHNDRKYHDPMAKFSSTDALPELAGRRSQIEGLISNLMKEIDSGNSQPS